MKHFQVSSVELKFNSDTKPKNYRNNPFKRDGFEK